MGTKYVKNNSNLYRHNSLDIQKELWYCVFGWREPCATRLTKVNFPFGFGLSLAIQKVLPRSSPLPKQKILSLAGRRVFGVEFFCSVKCAGRSKADALQERAQNCAGKGTAKTVSNTTLASPERR